MTAIISSSTHTKCSSGNSEISVSESSVDRGNGESVMNDDAETPLNNSNGSTFGSMSTPTAISPGSIVCSAQCCDLANPVQIRDKDAIRSTWKLQGKKWR